jgi:hypothetical protein
MSLDDAFDDAIGSPFGWDTDDISELFDQAGAREVARIACGRCMNNRAIGSVRRIKFRGSTMLIAGRREPVAIRDVVLRRHLAAHDTGAASSRRRPAPRPWMLEPADGPDDITAWCPRHHRVAVQVADLRDAIGRYDHATARRVVRQGSKFGGVSHINLRADCCCRIAEGALQRGRPRKHQSDDAAANTRATTSEALRLFRSSDDRPVPLVRSAERQRNTSLESQHVASPSRLIPVASRPVLVAVSLRRHPQESRHPERLRVGDRRSSCGLPVLLRGFGTGEP